MSKITKYNKGNRFNYEIPESAEFTNLKKLYEADKEKTHILHGLYISEKGQYGAAPVAISDGYLVNLPSHMVEDVKEMCKDSDIVDDINTGLCGFRVYKYQAHNKDCYGVTWVDM